MLIPLPILGLSSKMGSCVHFWKVMCWSNRSKFLCAEARGGCRAHDGASSGKFGSVGAIVANMQGSRTEICNSRYEMVCRFLKESQRIRVWQTLLYTGVYLFLIADFFCRRRLVRVGRP